jgi:hypothetical protein
VKYLLFFTVTGQGAFPLDMLRYDRCWPYDGQDVQNIDPRVTGFRGVRLAMPARTRADEPTVDRWKSFGWQVLKDSYIVQVAPK